MFTKVLIANRGAIACRIIRTLQRLGIGSVAVYSDADRYSLHVQSADEAIHVGRAPAAESYLNQQRIIDAALTSGAQAIHPGYGFLSENAAFAERCEEAGIAFIGPTPAQMRDFGLKHTARALAQVHQVPLLPGSGLLEDVEHALRTAEQIGYPIMLKSTAGGGGIGMQLCRSDAELREAFHSVERLARSNFSQGGVFLEKYVERARHIEVQIFGDGLGQVVTLGERDCSVQRRHQKVIEETPAPNLTDATRAQLFDCAQRLGAAVAYRSAGTVEFVYDDAAGQFYFLEVNTRLQVEHGVTEEVTGIDLVEWMIKVAAQEPPSLANYRHAPRGYAVQVRVYAEDPAHQFRPSSGFLSYVRLPQSVRVDHWIETGTDISSHYDPMLAKIIAHADTRDEALAKLAAALEQTRIYGIETNQAYLRAIIADDVFRAGRQFTRYLQTFAYRPRTIEVIQPGTHSTVQDFPARVGYWNIGVPPSGPMDDLSFRIANRLVGNDDSAAGLELTVTGPTLRFNCATTIALVGAEMRAELDDAPVAYRQPVHVPSGAVLKMRAIRGGGQRTYLAVRGGLDVPTYMGSRATFTLGHFGGHAGRALRAGDTLRVTEVGSSPPVNVQCELPPYTNEWTVAVMYGPHGAPDFFTNEDIDQFFAAGWRVHYNSSRTGVRLIGPKPTWARRDGGEAGLHPSNIHDNAYAIGAVDFTGDMPVILGPDGPSLGGFVCPVTVVRAELWKIGQLRPGDEIVFRCVTEEEARALEAQQEAFVAGLGAHAATESQTRPLLGSANASPILFLDESASPAVCYRQSGDKNLLVEYGPQILDLELRFRVHALMQALAQQRIAGLLELTPSVRSLQVHYDNRVLPQRHLVEMLQATERVLPPIDNMEVPSRIVHLPLSWDDPATRLAIEKYMQSVREDAPWCPSNIEFIRRINGLDSIEDVQRIVFGASYLVMGLGDVYLGAPVATPLDPRHRLVTTKYNPARTWTPENAVGIGGAYLCVYGMEGPGGYQFVGRTLQMWNRDGHGARVGQAHGGAGAPDGHGARVGQAHGGAGAPDGHGARVGQAHGGAGADERKQWLLRFFDQIRFYPVSAEELLQLRNDFPNGKVKLRIEPTTLRLREYQDFLRQNDDSIREFKTRQQAAFEAERERWRANGQLTFDGETTHEEMPATSTDVPDDADVVLSPVTGSVWQLNVECGRRVQKGDELLVIEAMKMEIPILADADGEVMEIRCEKGKSVAAGDVLVVLKR
jgi:urea carboxylase